MKVELNPLDPLSRKIYDAHKQGASNRSSVLPCTKCRNKPDGSIRGHFHGSEFGQCMLKTYLDCTSGSTFEDPLEGKVTEDDIDARAAFLLDGHLHEENIIKNIAASGMQIIGFGNKDENEKQIQVYFKESKNGESCDFTMPLEGTPNREKVLKGFEETFQLIVHLDGIMVVRNKKSNEEMIIGIECKSVKDYTWKKIKDTQEISDIWYGQIQSYFLFDHNISRFYLFVKHRHTSQLMKPILIVRNDEYINRRLNILYRVYNAILEDDPQKYNIEKEHNSIKDSECKFCQYKNRCYGKVELNTVYEQEKEED